MVRLLPAPTPWVRVLYARVRARAHTHTHKRGVIAHCHGSFLNDPMFQ